MQNAGVYDTLLRIVNFNVHGTLHRLLTYSMQQSPS